MSNEPMTLDEAIAHLKESSAAMASDVRNAKLNHEQLLAWLEKLRERRSNQTQSKITRPEPWKCEVCTG